MTAETTSPPTTLTESDLPPLHFVADRDAMRAQQRFFGLLSAELALLGLGALAGLLSVLPFIPSFKTAPFAIAGVSIPALPYADLVSAILIASALILRLWRFGAHPEDRWYEARAVAESAKSVAWRCKAGLTSWVRWPSTRQRSRLYSWRSPNNTRTYISAPGISLIRARTSGRWVSLRRSRC